MRLALKTAALVATMIPVFAAAQTYTVQEISQGGLVADIASGVAGGYSAAPQHATLWSLFGATDVHPSGFTFSQILGRGPGGISVGYGGTSSIAQSPLVWRGTAATALTVPFASIVGRAIATDGVQIVGTATEGDTERTFGAVHAMLWDAATGAATDLGKNLTINGVGGGVQVGYKVGSKGTTAGLWRGTSTSFVDLHPRFADVSLATDSDGAIQIGYIGVNVRVRNEAKPRDIRFSSAGFWTGSAGSFTYLSSVYRHSFALAIKGGTIVGYGNTTDAIGTPKESRAVAWVGPEFLPVDLHGMLPVDMRTSIANGIDENGNICGYGVTTGGQLKSFIWVRN